MKPIKTNSAKASGCFVNDNKLVVLAGEAELPLLICAVVSNKLSYTPYMLGEKYFWTEKK